MSRDRASVQALGHDSAPAHSLYLCSNPYKATFFYFFRLAIWRQLPVIAHNTSITHWHKSMFYINGRAETQWGLVQLNDHTHLRDISAAKRIDWQNLPPMPIAWKEKE